VGDVEAARDLLQLYEETQRLHLADQDRILQELRK
jgi:hypothetical protein